MFKFSPKFEPTPRRKSNTRVLSLVIVSSMVSSYLNVIPCFLKTTNTRGGLYRCVSPHNCVCICICIYFWGKYKKRKTLLVCISTWCFLIIYSSETNTKREIYRCVSPHDCICICTLLRQIQEEIFTGVYLQGFVGVDHPTPLTTPSPNHSPAKNYVFEKRKRKYLYKYIISTKIKIRKLSAQKSV